MSTPLSARVVQANALAYRGTWKGTVVTAFVNPILFLVAMGQGLGTLVDRGISGAPLGVGYLEFIAPGLLAAAALQTSATESTWPIMAGVKWQKRFHAAVATPIRIVDLVSGTLVWITIRILMTCVAFAIVTILIGAIPADRAIGAIFPALLCGVAFGAPLVGYTAIAKNESRLSTIFRFAVIPMFLFSGTFFPIEQLPGWLQPIAYVTPLWHGVDLCRSIALGVPAEMNPLIHIAYLGTWVAAGWLFATRSFPRVLNQ